MSPEQPPGLTDADLDAYLDQEEDLRTRMREPVAITDAQRQEMDRRLASFHDRLLEETHPQAPAHPPRPPIAQMSSRMAEARKARGLSWDETPPWYRRTTWQVAMAALLLGTVGLIGTPDAPEPGFKGADDLSALLIVGHAVEPAGNIRTVVGPERPLPPGAWSLTVQLDSGPAGWVTIVHESPDGARRLAHPADGASSLRWDGRAGLMTRNGTTDPDDQVLRIPLTGGPGSHRLLVWVTDSVGQGAAPANPTGGAPFGLLALGELELVVEGP